jgi:hypothetical protein
VIQRRIRGVLVSSSRRHIMRGSQSLLTVDVVHVPVIFFVTGSGGFGYSSAVSVDD